MRMVTYSISIHALRMERDFLRCLPGGNRDYFNPRAPHGARPGRRCASRAAPSISIHALRMERDGSNREALFVRSDFNPRAPHGARPGASVTIEPVPDISIHALRMERDYLITPEDIGYIISIHALRMERDETTDNANCPTEQFQSTRSAWSATGGIGDDRTSARYFNPRAPHGARLSYHTRGYWLHYFNPRAPHGARRAPLS